MEALNILKFWRNAVATADVISDVRNAASGSESDESDDDDSFFDLVIKSPQAKKGGEANPQFIESPRDVFLSKNDSTKPLSPATATLLRSAPKFKVFMLGLKKSPKSEPNQLTKPSKIEQSNRFNGFNLRSEEMAVTARDNSLRSKLLKDSNSVYDVVLPEKSVPKYLKLIKPFYTKKAKLTTESVTPSCSPVTAPVNFSPRKLSEGSRIGSFKIVARNLGKSRSATMTVGATAAPPPLRRRDDSLMEQNDGIQGAILHCKKSFNSSSSNEYSQLFRSASDASYPVRKSYEEQKRCSI